MKILKIITLLTFLSLLVMCSSEQRKKQNIKMIKNDKYIIPDSLYAFFPKKDSDCKLGIYITNAVENNLPYFFEEFSINYIIKVYSYNNNKLVTALKKDFLRTSINKFTAKDSTYFIIGSERNLLKEYDSLQIKNIYHNYQKNSLILNFGDFFKNKSKFYSQYTLCKLPESYDILILKMNYKNVLDAKYTYNWDLLPERLKHGYTSGVAFNQTDPYIIYWVVA